MFDGVAHFAACMHIDAVTFVEGLVDDLFKAGKVWLGHREMAPKRAVDDPPAKLLVPDRRRGFCGKWSKADKRRRQGGQSQERFYISGMRQTGRIGQV
ncbi:hypothetical protein PPNSA23_06900 [Phyllobacterium phragmitis]|uniref:Uncharacterized protein n=1 Tax=Phyllobacterium phragmitis TaxID=2670329 RepID=A0ABQ0GVP8_9HYPH